MKKNFFILMTVFLSLNAYAVPTRYLELLPFVQPAPDQGSTGTCLYVASTGAIELLANRKQGIKYPQAYGPNDLSESFIIKAPNIGSSGKWWIEKPVLRFNKGYGIHISSWPFESWNDGSINRNVWNNRNTSGMQRVQLPKVSTVKLFTHENRYATNVLDESHLEKIKSALHKYKAPVLVNYKDNNYWHAILIVGYDNELPGECYQISNSQCDKTKGSFYVRDSFGTSIEVRDYDWFRVKGNTAIVVKEASD